MIAEIVVEIIMIYLMYKYAMRMENNNFEAAIRLLEDKRLKKKMGEDTDDKAPIFNAIVEVILFLFPVILFIDSCVILVKNLSSYERFVAIYEK